jgi:hypothetical protein
LLSFSFFVDVIDWTLCRLDIMTLRRDDVRTFHSSPPHHHRHKCCVGEDDIEWKDECCQIVGYDSEQGKDILYGRKEKEKRIFLERFPPTFTKRRDEREPINECNEEDGMERIFRNDPQENRSKCAP